MPDRMIHQMEIAKNTGYIRGTIKYMMQKETITCKELAEYMSEIHVYNEAIKKANLELI